MSRPPTSFARPLQPSCFVYIKDMVLLRTIINLFANILLFDSCFGRFSMPRSVVEVHGRRLLPIAKPLLAAISKSCAIGVGVERNPALRTKIGRVDSPGRRHLRIKSQPRIGLIVPISQVEFLTYRNGKYYTVARPRILPGRREAIPGSANQACF